MQEVVHSAPWSCGRRGAPDHGQITPCVEVPCERSDVVRAADPAVPVSQRCPMTPDQIFRVRASWTLLVPVAETVAGRFYERLFELDPSLKPLFAASDPSSQRRKLMQTLAMIVAAIDDLERVVPAAEALGRRHEGYGVRPDHYATVGEALLWTLQRALGDAFDDATRCAWTEAFAAITLAMLGRERPVTSPPATAAGELV